MWRYRCLGCFGSAFCPRFCPYERLELCRGVIEIGLAGDVVAVKYSPGAVPGDGHRYCIGDAGPGEVLHRRAAEVVRVRVHALNPITRDFG